MIQAINEEKDWHYVKQSHINEVLLGKDRALFEVSENRIRAMERRWRLDLKTSADSLPAIFYCAIRAKAHPVVMEKGLRSTGGRYLVLSNEKEVCFRIGRRRDQQPVLLEIMAESASGQGVLFYPFGRLFLSFEIPSEFIAGPPVSKEILEIRRHKEEKEKKEAKVRHIPVSPTAGTFVLDSSRDPDPFRRAKGKKRRGWKEEARNMRRTRR